MIMPGSPAEPDGDVRSDAASASANGAGRSLSLDDFVVLNNEIQSFVRAGIPLNMGLKGTASRSAGLLRDVSDRVADRISQGKSLPEAIEAEGTAVPAEYRALLTAGLRTGRLPEVLSSISALGESVSRLTRQFRLAMIYPAIVFVVAYVLFIGLMVYVVPTFHRTYEVFRAEESVFLRGLLMASETVGIWGIGLPALLIGIWGLSSIWRRLTGSGSTSMDGLRWLPGGRSVAVARFAHVLSVLTEYAVPLPEAARLSGEASGSARLQSAANTLADDVESGRSLSESLRTIDALPAFLRWLMTVGEQRGALSQALGQAAAVYEQRALSRLEWFRRIVPPAIVLIFGTFLVLTYALSVFVPLTELLQSMKDTPR